MMGNRGVLHNAQRAIVRDWQVRRWIACRLEFRGRHRAVMQPQRYTELFFLDEATALADGHRPCAECRFVDYQAFQAIWRKLYPDTAASAADIDRVLHSERRDGPFSKRTHVARIENLPDGAYIVVEDAAWLVLGDSMFAWSSEGYTERRRRPDAGDVIVLTPPSIVAVFQAGFRPGVHLSAAG